MCSTMLSGRRSAIALFVLLSSVSIQLTAQSTPPRHGAPTIDKPFTVEHGAAMGTISPNVAPTNPGSILGDTVEIVYRYPTMASPYEGIMASGVVTPEGVRLNLFNNQEVVVFPDSVDLISINPVSYFSAAPFNGVSVQDLTHPAAFIKALIGVKGNVAGFSTANVSELDSLLFVNYEGLLTPSGAFESVKFFVFDQDDAE